jgi:hypothetical protein
MWAILAVTDSCLTQCKHEADCVSGRFAWKCYAARRTKSVQTEHDKEIGKEAVDCGSLSVRSFYHRVQF